MLLVQYSVIVQMYDVIWSSFKKNGKNIVTQLGTGEIGSKLNT